MGLLMRKSIHTLQHRTSVTEITENAEVNIRPSATHV